MEPTAGSVHSCPTIFHIRDQWENRKRGFIDSAPMYRLVHLRRALVHCFSDFFAAIPLRFRRNILLEGFPHASGCFSRRSGYSASLRSGWLARELSGYVNAFCSGSGPGFSWVSVRSRGCEGYRDIGRGFLGAREVCPRSDDTVIPRFVDRLTDISRNTRRKRSGCGWSQGYRSRSFRLRDMSFGRSLS